jgi:hypothetical protein
MRPATSQAKQVARHRALQREWLAITRRYPQADPDNVWHTLLLLDEPPFQRLQRGLRRAQGKDLFAK